MKRGMGGTDGVFCVGAPGSVHGVEGGYAVAGVEVMDLGDVLG